MAGSSTAVVVISNSKLGPFGDHIWKTRHAMVLVENWITYGFLPQLDFHLVRLWIKHP